jgi:hypothetical protein
MAASCGRKRTKDGFRTEGMPRNRSGLKQRRPPAAFADSLYPCESIGKDLLNRDEGMKRIRKPVINGDGQ